LAVEPTGEARLGANWTASSTHFSIWSPAADRLELCLFDPQDHSRETARIDLTASNGAWAAEVPGVAPGTPYGFRAHGPYDPSSGMRFNPAKLLVDPHARSIAGTVTWNPAVLGYPFGKPDSGKPNPSDSAGFVPRSIVVDPAFDWMGVGKPGIPLSETVIYEAHVKGLTKLHPDVPPEQRGTYAGAAHPAVIGYLKDLGITAIELLPVHTHVDDGFLVERGLRNYWGYSTLGFFSPDARYASSPQPGAEVTELKVMVREFHRAGIEVFLDVVYNHTCEANHLGPTLSFRGLHNPEFYLLCPRDRSRYADLTGTGNTIRVEHPDVTRFVVESLRYWAEEMGVDGFRFDLAPVLGRTDEEFERHAPFFDAVSSDPVVSRAKLIAEPWDIGPGGYQVGGFPDNWSEWNDRYRDLIRSFWRSDDGRLREMGFRLTGSADFYGQRAIGPCASVNFIAAHDGMTTADLIAYHSKRNYANGDANSDGHGNDVNQFIGPDGPVSDPELEAARLQRARNLIGTVIVSRGVPMLLGGDEFGRTQRGNNNAYCQDNETSWIDWSLREVNADLRQFVREWLRLRREQPALRIERFPDDSIDEADPWLWFSESGAVLRDFDWNNAKRRAFGVCMDAAGEDNVYWLLLLFNAGGKDINFAIPSWIAATDLSAELLCSTVETERNPLIAPASSLSVVKLTVNQS
jgi:isoamylase